MKMRPSFRQISLVSGVLLIVIALFFFFTSSLNAIYFVQEKDGSLQLKRDLLLEESDKLVFMLNFTGILSQMDRNKAYASHKPMLELAWDEDSGRGNVKEFRPDGTAISVAFSRFSSGSGTKPQGLFIGGDLPFGDAFRSERMNTSGYGYYDGKQWYHIWCTANEAFNLAGSDEMVTPVLWSYTGSSVLKNSEGEIIIESYHKKVINGVPVKMTRRAIMRAGTGYLTLKVSFTNDSDKPVMYSFAYGDEPWIGSFGASRGDVGWYQGGFIQKETSLSPNKYRYAGYWDFGNSLAGEKPVYTGYANFIEWDNPVPSMVTLSNSTDRCCDENRPLDDESARSIVLTWLSQSLQPGETRTYTMAIGMARLGERRGFPEVPEHIF